MSPSASPRTLAGQRVLVTRATHQAGKLSAGLRALGAIPVEVAVLEIQPPASFDRLDHALETLSTYHWLVLTSANAVRALAERADHLSVKLSHAALGLRVAAVGPATAAAARQQDLNVTIVPESYVAESLIAALGDLCAGRKVLLARAEVARDVIPDALRDSGAMIEVIDAYRNLMPADAPGLLRAALATGVDAAIFTSSSSATHLRRAADAAGLPWPLERVAAVSIGPITSATLRNSGWEPAIEAAQHDVAGLLAAVCQLFGPASA